MKGILLVALTCCGCAHFVTTQKDIRYDENGQKNEITTKASAFTFWDSESALANFKATQTEKTQSATVGSLNQSASSTNAAATLGAVADLLRAIRP